MKETIESGSPSRAEGKISKCDWIVLPVLSIVTFCLLSIGTELIARWVLPASKSLAEDCMVSNDASTGMRGIPNAVCWDRVLDAEPTEYRFNSSGYRSNEEFGPKPDGTFRIVMVGTSFATGLRVPVNETFAELLPLQLTELTGRKVQLYNEAIVRRLPDVIAQHFNEVAKVKPDMILWVVTRSDVQSTAMIPRLEFNHQLGSENMLQRDWRFLRTEPLGVAIEDIFNRTHTSTLIRLLLYQSQSMYVKSYLMGSDNEIGYLRAHPSAQWQNRLREFDVYAAQLEQDAEAIGVPLVVAYLPRGPQAAMISMKEWSEGYDPYMLDDELRAIIVRHGGTYIDILPEFRLIPHPERGYYRVEGHPNAKGHAIIASLLAKELTRGAVPALRVADQSPPAFAFAQRR